MDEGRVAFKIGIFIAGLIVGGLVVALMNGANFKLTPNTSSTYNFSGITGEGLALIKDNKVVENAELHLVLRGVVNEVKGDNTFTVINDGAPITIQVSSQTRIFEPPRDAKSQVKDLKFQDLAPNDVISVFGKLQDNQVIADSVVREAPPPPPTQ